MCAGLSSRPGKARLPAGLSHGAQRESTCLEVLGRPLTDPVILPSVPAAACQVPLSPVLSLPPSSCFSVPAGCIHFSFETRLGICHAPTAIKLDQQPLTCLPCAEGLMQPQWALGSSGGAARLCCSRACSACSWLQASLSSYLISPPSSSSPFC